jgi:glutathione synthase
MRFVYVMDPMDRVLPDKDTTFAFQRAAQRRGHKSLHAELRDVYVLDGDVWARVRELTVSDTAPHATFGKATDVRLADVECVLIRKDPPFDAEYLYVTLMLEKARGRTLIINDPRGLRDANEKLYTLHFARHMPRTLVTANRDRIHRFFEEVGVGVVKPLDGAGGSGVMVVQKGDRNARSIVDYITHEGTRLAMAQQFLEAVRQGDKRVLLLEGEILGAINRIARDDDVRSNIHAGGRVEACEVTAEERAIVADIRRRSGLRRPRLHRRPPHRGERHVAHGNPGAQPAPGTRRGRGRHRVDRAAAGRLPALPGEHSAVVSREWP